MSTASPADQLCQLATELQQLDQLLTDDAADQANRLMMTHDSHLRTYLALPAEDIDVQALALIQTRHSELLARMEKARDQAAEQLRTHRTTRSAVSAYQISRNY